MTSPASTLMLVCPPAPEAPSVVLDWSAAGLQAMAVSDQDAFPDSVTVLMPRLAAPTAKVSEVLTASAGPPSSSWNGPRPPANEKSVPSAGLADFVIVTLASFTLVNVQVMLSPGLTVNETPPATCVAVVPVHVFVVRVQPDGVVSVIV